MRTAYVAYLFFKEAAHRVIGIDREASVATTAFATAVFTSAIASVAAPALRPLRPRRPPPPPPGDVLAGIALVRHAAHSIGGAQLRDSPLADVIIVSCFVVPALKVIMLPVRMAQAAMAALARAWRYAMRAEPQASR